jgi:hypothetical protein
MILYIKKNKIYIFLLFIIIILCCAVHIPMIFSRKNRKRRFMHQSMQGTFILILHIGKVPRKWFYSAQAHSVIE